VPDLSITQSWSITISGQVFTGGSSTPVVVSASNGLIFDRTYSVTTATYAEIARFGSASDDDLADFVFLFIQSDVAAEIRLVTDVDGNNSRQGLAIQLAAGVPLMLTGGDAARATTTIDEVAAAGNWATTGADVHDFIEYYQTSGGAAKVRVVAIR